MEPRPRSRFAFITFCKMRCPTRETKILMMVVRLLPDWLYAIPLPACRGAGSLGRLCLHGVAEFGESIGKTQCGGACVGRGDQRHFSAIDR
jgi:hypothetical protein